MRRWLRFRRYRCGYGIHVIQLGPLVFTWSVARR